MPTASNTTVLGSGTVVTSGERLTSDSARVAIELSEPNA